MEQFKGVRYRVAAGDPTVRAIWKVNGTLGGTGAFSDAENLTWTGGGGVYVGDGNGSQLEFYRTSGATLPAVNTLISGTTRTFLITSLLAENLSLTAPVAATPPYFATTGGSQGAVTAGDEFHIAGQPAAIISAPASDYFNLSAGWAGVTLTNVEGVVNRSRTSNQGWPIAEQGSRIPWATNKDALRQIDAWAGSNATVNLTMAGSHTATAAYAQKMGGRVYIYIQLLGDGTSWSAAEQLATVPVGFRPASTLRFSATTSNTAACRIDIDSSGVLTSVAAVAGNPSLCAHLSYSV